MCCPQSAAYTPARAVAECSCSLETAPSLQQRDWGETALKEASLGCFLSGHEDQLPASALGAEQEHRGWELLAFLHLPCKNTSMVFFHALDKPLRA